VLHSNRNAIIIFFALIAAISVSHRPMPAAEGNRVNQLAQSAHFTFAALSASQISRLRARSRIRGGGGGSINGPAMENIPDESIGG
jgi:hypothetical protein